MLAYTANSLECQYHISGVRNGEELSVCRVRPDLRGSSLSPTSTHEVRSNADQASDSPDVAFGGASLPGVPLAMRALAYKGRYRLPEALCSCGVVRPLRSREIVGADRGAQCPGRRIRNHSVKGATGSRSVPSSPEPPRPRLRARLLRLDRAGREFRGVQGQRPWAVAARAFGEPLLSRPQRIGVADEC